MPTISLPPHGDATTLPRRPRTPLLAKTISPKGAYSSTPAPVPDVTVGQARPRWYPEPP